MSQNVIALSQPYAQPRLQKSLLQLSFNLAFLFLTWVSIGVFIAHGWNPVWLVPLDILNAIMLVRTFIVQHDCSHGSFFTSYTLNVWVGRFLGIFTLTPFDEWKHSHALHHQQSGNLSKYKGDGSIPLYTLEQFNDMSAWRRKVLRIIRNPFVFFLFVPAVLFFVLHHFAIKKNISTQKKCFSVATTLSSVGLLVFFSYVFGTAITLLTWLPGAYLASVIAVWLFFIQHSFEDAYWQPSNTFSAEHSALHGSSFLNFPKFLHWCTGNIGYHHIHHANSKIPNYNLTRCHRQVAAFQECKTITFWEMFKSYNLVLWDEHQQKLIPLPTRA